MENENYKNLMHKSIELIGIKTHGIKNISVSIPHDKITTITGLSGSGKSSLAIDTLFAEGQRRYIESLSSYARQFLNKFEKPEFEKITGLRPAIAIEQKTQGYNPRSTVGTVTEIYDYLRVLFARIGVPHSPYTNLPLQAYSPSEITDFIYEKKIKECQILSPIVKNKKGTFRFELAKLQQYGFDSVIIDNVKADLDFLPDLDKNKFHNIDILIGSFDLELCQRYEIENACSSAIKQSNGLVKIMIDEHDTQYFSSTSVCPISGFSLTELTPRLFSFNSPVGACKKCSGIGQIYTDIMDVDKTCPACKGVRLNEHALCVKINEKDISQITKMNLEEAKNWIDNIKIKPANQEIATPIITEISKRLGFLINVGLHYITIQRAAQTLSGGESQRIRLASQIGAGLEGVLYVLDEPSIGLHSQDQNKLINTLKKLRNLGNTIVIVEHDAETMLASDHIIEMGPKAGIHGGEIMFSGSVKDLLKKKDSLTAQYLNKTKTIGAQIVEVDWKTCEKLQIVNANLNNLENVCVDIPLNHLIGVCGVSGSGKSSLIMEVLTTAIKCQKNDLESKLCKVEGTIPPFEIIDQSPIGRTPRSTPSTYTGLMTHLRDWYAQLPDSKARGYTSSRFSFNVAVGRCRLCSGEGMRHIEMHFLPDVQIQCESCLGKRYNQETLEIKYEGLSIYDALNLTIEEALQVFNFIPAMKNMLQTLCDVHLGYLKLGQNAITLSGGEGQRLKLAKILGVRKQNPTTLYILDEPTTGLHFDDTQALLQVLRKLVNKGNTVLIIEHQIDMLKAMDWLIELGPKGGKEGGNIIAQGNWKELKKLKTPTGKFF